MIQLQPCPTCKHTPSVLEQIDRKIVDAFPDSRPMRVGALCYTGLKVKADSTFLCFQWIWFLPRPAADSVHAAIYAANPGGVGEYHGISLMDTMRRGDQECLSIADLEVDPAAGLQRALRVVGATRALLVEELRRRGAEVE